MTSVGDLAFQTIFKQLSGFFTKPSGRLKNNPSQNNKIPAVFSKRAFYRQARSGKMQMPPDAV
ncbi:hypothetical protein EGS38_03835 [Neisseria chenwenguii]|nr:hypothetical protein EGS38_03835 [Neisseria chenwenguii]